MRFLCRGSHNPGMETPTREGRMTPTTLAAQAAPSPSGPATTHQTATAALTLAALGVVFGDIGTSPLYTMKEIFAPSTGVPLEPATVVGAVSVVIWALMLVVT